MNLPSLVRAVYRAYVQADMPTEKAKRLISDPEAPATGLLVACRSLLPDEFHRWEPETLWLELGDVPALNRDKILAAIALDVHPSFFWDPRVFGNTVLAFANEAVFAGVPPQPSPAAMAWGAFEGELLFAVTDPATTTPVYGDDVIRYVAALLHDAGYVASPEHLEFADDDLSSLLNSGAKRLRSEVKKAEHPKTDTDTDLGVQLARLSECGSYVDARLESLSSLLR